MATLPFDPTPLIPPNHQIIEVEGRPARARVVAGAVAKTHEEWVIATIVPMPNLPVAFNNIREVLTEFLSKIKHIGFSEITPCPFGQAYIKLDNVFDRNALLRGNPHPFTDVHVIFQEHNESINWRKFVLNREVWLMLCGFALDRRCMHEIANAVRSFGKLVHWDRVKSTRANLLVKVRVEELRDIPASVVIGEGEDIQTESESVPIVILQQHMLGAEAPDEDPIPPDGNPHPIPLQANFHAN